MSDPAGPDRPSRGQAGARLNLLLESLVEADRPSQVLHLVVDDTPAARFLQDDSESRTLTGETTIHYAGAELAVVSRPVAADTADRAYCLFGTDRFHEIGVVGIPLATENRPDVWTRTTVLEALDIDGWHPIDAGDEAHRDGLLPFNQWRRLQGRTAVGRLRSEDYQQSREEVLEAPVPPLEDAFVGQGTSAKMAVGDQTIVIEEAGELNAYNTIERRRQPDLSATVLIPPETPVAVTGPTTERRQFTANGGVYFFEALGTDQFVTETDEQRPHVHG